MSWHWNEIILWKALLIGTFEVKMSKCFLLAKI